jgi:hypothetical protein
MIKLFDILNEIKINPKKELGVGGSMVAYPSSLHPNKIIKITHSEEHDLLQFHAEMFNRYPEVFPKVYKITDKYILVEKLDTKPITNYIKKLREVAKSKLTLNNLTLPTAIRNYYTEYPHMIEYAFKYSPLSNIEHFDIKYVEHDKFYINSIFNWVVRQDAQLLEITKKLYQLYRKVDKILYDMDLDKIDFHEENIGVDSKGKWKMLDF